MKKQEILKIAQSNAERISAIEKHLGIDQPKAKGLEVGKWYWLSNGNLIYATALMDNNHISGYGFGRGGEDWSDEYEHWLVDGEFSEAAPQEVEEALIREAKKRGLATIGQRFISPLGQDYGYSIKTNVFCFCPINNRLTVRYNDFVSYYIFLDGEWATIVDKFADLKEAHKNGAVVQYEGLAGEWIDIDGEPAWYDDHEYRIKPEAGPKVGDVCKFWDDDEKAFVVSTYAEERVISFPDDDEMKSHIHGVRVRGNYQTRFYKNAKPLTKSEAIELLFGKGESNV